MEVMHCVAYFKLKIIKRQTWKELANLTPKNYMWVYKYTYSDM